MHTHSSKKIQKKTLKTVLMIVAVIALIQGLFLNKMLTPRYLSDLDLKINGLVLLQQPQSLSAEALGLTPAPGEWLLLAGNSAQQQVLTDFVAGLKTKIQQQTAIVDIQHWQGAGVDLGADYDSTEAIGIVDPKQRLVGYLKPPFNDYRMTLTYSSIVTHR